MAGADREAAGDALPAGLQRVLAPNASPLTLDGTRTYVVGSRRVAIIDPGPDDPEHLGRLARLAGEGGAVVLLTHSHPDHAAGAAALADRLGTEVRSVDAGTLGEGDTVSTDAGGLTAHLAPGHTPDHAIFHWSRERAVFCGDLMMGGQETALVAPPEGDLGEYLQSLERIRRLEPRLILPSHGPPIRDAARALDTYVRHRELRLRQVLAALEAGAPTLEDVVDGVYGAGLSAQLREAARGSVLGYLEQLRRTGRITDALEADDAAE